MGTTSIRDVICGGLTEIANIIAPAVDVPKKELERLCTALSEVRANDQVVIEHGWSKGALGLTYSSRFSGASHLLITDSTAGHITEGHVARTPAYQFGVLARILIGGLRGLQGLSQEAVQEVTNNPVLLGAVQYLACAQANGRAACDAAADTLQDAAHIESLRRHAGKEGQLADALYYEAVQIWSKVDNFLRNGRQVDSDDSDLDKLDTIPLKYAVGRPIMRPRSLADAEGLLRVARQMLREFETNEAIASFVYDEGVCDTQSIGAHTYVRACAFSGYVFTQQYSVDEKPEREKPDLGKARP